MKKISEKEQARRVRAKLVTLQGRLYNIESEALKLCGDWKDSAYMKPCDRYVQYIFHGLHEQLFALLDELEH